MRQDDAGLVAREYSTMERVALRRLDRTARLSGELEWTVALSAIAETRPDRVLDAGCGTGEFAALIPAPGLVCVDSSPPAVAAARAHGLDAKLAKIEELPFPDGEFDVVTWNWTLYHLPDRDRGITELARVLRPAGRFVGIYNFPDHLQEVWRATGVTWDAAGFDAEAGRAQLSAHFAKVRQEETHGEAVWDDPRSLQTYLDAYLELAGPLVAPRHPYPFRSQRHVCVFIATRA
ncbi:MAG: class I SAM-dependent methyltransferase [Candidatus Dormiibacterota bacterium]